MNRRTHTELLKGMLQAIVLDVLSDGTARYGVEVRAELGRRGVAVAEGTLYPALHRLAAGGRVTFRWDEQSASGHPRKYYRILAGGRRLLAESKREIRKLAAAARASR